MGIVQQTVASGTCGIFALGLRGYSESASKFNFSWICKTSGTVPLLRVVINGHTVKLYCKVYGGQYQFAHIRLLDQCNQFEANSYKTSFFTLANSTTIIPEADVPSGTDIADAPYLLKTAAAEGSKKVLQTNATSSAERRVLLGENHETTQQDAVYKSANLTFNPSTKTLTVPTIKNPNGSWAHIAYKTRGTAGYVKVATITINQTHADEPIYFDIIQRQQPIAKLRLQYSTTSNTNPSLNTFSYQGTSVNRYYIHQTGSGVWDLYVGKLDSWTAITVSKVSIGGYSNGYYQNPHFTITWQDELVTAVPEGSVAATKATEYVNIDGNSNSAKKLVTSRKIGFASFDGTADITPFKFQNGFSLRWTTNTTQWQRIVRLKTNKTYTRRQLIMGVYDTENGHFSGTIKVTLIVSNKLTSGGPFATVNWLSLWESPQYRGHQGAFKVVVIYPTDSDENVYLDVYANTPYTYENYTFTVLSCNDASGLTIGNSGEWVEGSALQNVIATSTTDTSLISNQSLSATDSAFLQSLEGLCHKSNDSSLDLRRRAEYICGQQVLSDTEEAGKAFFGSSANPLVISVPLKDPSDAVVGGKVNVNLIRYYYTENYWQELFFAVTSPNIYTRRIGGGKASQWYRMMKEGNTTEYNALVTKAITATNADVANKTKYPIVFKRNGASITNWFANTTFAIDIPEELLDYSAPTGITLKVPEIDVANKVANKLSLTVNGSTTEYDGSAGARVSIKANCTHIVKANSSNSLGILYPEQTGHPSAVTVPISILPLEPYNSAARGLNDGDTLILHIPNSMSNPTANYVWCVKLDITKENAADNIIPLIHGQSAGTPAYWNTSTTIPAGFYQFVYSATLGGLVYMYRNTSTT